MIKMIKTIKNTSGLHARPAKIFVSTAREFDSAISVAANGRKANGKNIFGVMGLGASKGITIEVEIDGPDEKSASEKIEELFNCNFYEK